MTQYEMNCLVERTAKRVVELLRQVSMVATENVMNARQAAQYLGVSRKTIYNLCAEGILPHTKTGGRLTFTEESLYEHLHR
jgi:excisionase family DNA binding protein